MKRTKTFACATYALLFLVGCSSGSGGGSPPTGGNSPPGGTITPARFEGIVGTAPADAALGQPLTVEWTLPTGFTISSVQLDANVAAGELANPSTCSVSSGALPAASTSATITIPNACEDKTVHTVDLILTVNGTGAQQTFATYSFFPPSPTDFVPQRINLPVLRLTTDTGLPVTSKEDYVTGQWTLEDAATISGTLEIRGRGNSTWDLHPKKSYRIKLSDEQALLDMPSSKHWVLIANHADKTLVRNRLAMEFGTSLGMAWTPHTASVEVFLNGRYEGVYLLSENIRIAEDRVNIDELAADDVSADVISGGYLLEVDFRRDGYTMDTAIDELPIVFQDPEEPAPEQEAYIKNYINEFESVLHSDGFADPTSGYAAYIDVDSFIRWYLVNEVFRNVDANMWSSCWMYKPRDGKLHMGPLWDFDLAAGNANYDDAFQTTGWWIREAPWFNRLFEDPAFAGRVREVWNEIHSEQIPALLEAIHTRTASMQQAQLNNFQRWPILDMYVWPNYTIPGTYAGEVAYIDEWLRARIAWMDDQFNP